MKENRIIKDNYFETIQKIGFEKLPLILKQSHTVIMTKTDMGADWSRYDQDPDLKRMVNLAFRKLEEFIKSKKSKAGESNLIKNEKPSTKQKGNNHQAAKVNSQKNEFLFINRFLKFKGKDITKKQLQNFIDELQSAIKNNHIKKTSPLSSTVLLIQDKLLSVYNSMKGESIKMDFKPETVSQINQSVKKAKQVGKRKAGVRSKRPALNGLATQGSQNDKPTILSSSDFANIRFSTLGFKDKWHDFIGDPTPGFTVMVYGKPKMGKSYLCLDFAGYLAKNHGKVLYVAKEEKFNPTLQIKLKDKNVIDPNLFIADSLPNNLSGYQFVFIDSVNKQGLSPKDLEKLKTEYPTVSFIYVFQVTKDGKARGSNEYPHDMDAIIEIPERGKAVQYGRFNQGGEMDIFPENTF